MPLTPKEPSSLFFGWVILAISCITIVVAYSSRYAFSVFYVVMLDEFEWTYSATSAAMSINLIIYTSCCPIVGALVDRFGARKIIPIGSILLGIALVGCSRIDSIWHFYLFYGLTAVGTATIGTVPNMALLSNWFIKRRGFVLSLVISALGFAMLLTPYAQHLISTLGWRATYLVLAGMAILVVMMPNAIFLRNRPEDKGLLPDGGNGNVERNAEDKKRAPVVIDRDWTGKEWTVKLSIRTCQFWGLILMHVFFGIYTYTLIVHQVVYLVKEIGFSAMFGAAVFGCFGIFFAIGSGLGGYLSDRIGRETIFTFGSIGCFLGVILLLQISDTRLQWLSYLYAVLFGISNGSLGGLFAPIVADFFAGKHYGAINGIMIMAMMAGGSFGPWIGGIVRDVTGSFSIVFLALLFIICAAAIILWGVAPRKVRTVS